MQETQIQSLDWEDTLEEGMATHFSILHGESDGQRSLVGYNQQSCIELDMTEATEHACLQDQMQQNTIWKSYFRAKDDNVKIRQLIDIQNQYVYA